MVSARSAGVIHSGAPNDVIQALLVAARSADLIDGVVMLDMDKWTLEPVARVATTVHEIVSSVGMQYLWAPVLSVLNEAIFELGLTRLAVVGPPCVAEGARRMMNTEHERLWPYREAIRLTIASFCTGMYMPDMVTELLEQGKGIPRQQIRSLTTSVTDGMLTVTLWDGAELAIPLTDVEPFTRSGCGSCDDYLGESADLAVGTVGALPDHATRHHPHACGRGLRPECSPLWPAGNDRPGGRSAAGRGQGGEGPAGARPGFRRVPHPDVGRA